MFLNLDDWRSFTDLNLSFHDLLLVGKNYSPTAITFPSVMVADRTRLGKQSLRVLPARSCPVRSTITSIADLTFWHKKSRLSDDQLCARRVITSFLGLYSDFAE